MKAKKGLKRVCIKTIQLNKGLTLLLLFAIAGSILAGLLPPLLLERIINQILAKDGALLRPAVFYFLLLVIAGLFDAGKEILITVFGQKITRGLRHNMCEKLSKLPAEYFISHEPGKITSGFVNDVDTLETLFTNGIISMFTDACKIVSIVAIIWTKSRGLGILLLIVTPLLFGLTRLFQKRMQKAQLQNRAAIARVNNHIPETVDNIRMIHSFYKQEYMEKRYDDYIEESHRAVEKSNFYDAIYSPIIIFTSAFLIGAMMVLSAMGGGMQEFFGMSVGTSVAVIAYVGKVFDPLESIGMEIQNIQSAMAGIKRINLFLQEPEKEKEETPAADCLEGTEYGADFAQTERDMRKGLKQEKTPCIIFENLSFGYQKGQRVLHNLNLEIKKGEHVTLTGRTGAGKSTVFRLLLGMYPPTEGSVRIYGKEACRILAAGKRNFFGYVEQDFKIVKGTVGEQITLFDENISTKQMEMAAKTAGIHESIMKLKKGYETPMNERLFSRGQLQLLSIARAVVKNPHILLLDEITANLDSQTEKLLMEALEQASKERTVVSISHRLYEQKNMRVVSIESL